MPQFQVKYADARGSMKQQVAEAASERELRDQFAAQGMLVYSLRERSGLEKFSSGLRRRGKIDVERFLIFNQQFVTLFKAGLPILKCLDLLADRLTDPKLGRHIQEIRDDVRRGTLLSEAFRKQNVFPAIYTTSVMAGEKSGALGDVLERYINYQKLALAVRKKILLSLLYPAVLITLVIGLIIFLVTYVVPNFAQLYSSMSAQLPALTRMLIAFSTSAQSYVVSGGVTLFGAIFAARLYLRTRPGRLLFDRIKLRTPLFGEIWIKYQVAQFARLMSTILTGGIPLVQGLETAGESLGSPLLKDTFLQAQQRVKEGQALSAALAATKVVPPLAIDMIEVGESTGALAAMLSSVAEFYEDDVQTRMTAVLSLIEPAIMLCMGGFVAFVLVSLYLPIFSLADTFGG
jgi:type IV pilus assembly protein PilC